MSASIPDRRRPDRNHVTTLFIRVVTGLRELMACGLEWGRIQEIITRMLGRDHAAQ